MVLRIQDSFLDHVSLYLRGMFAAMYLAAVATRFGAGATGKGSRAIAAFAGSGLAGGFCQGATPRGAAAEHHGCVSFAGEKKQIECQLLLATLGAERKSFRAMN